MKKDELYLKILELTNLKNIEADVSTGLIVSHRNRKIFVLQNKNRWRIKNGKIVAGLVGIGGKLEEGETLIDCVIRECYEEIGVKLKLLDSKQTFYFFDGMIRKISFKGPLRPLFIIKKKKTEVGRKPYSLIVSFRGQIFGEPRPLDISAITWFTDKQLTTFSKGPVLLSELLKIGVVIKEKEKLPNTLLIEPFGTAKAYISLLNFKNKNQS
jgi:8-oxo-dGTP pyrophosphatase MutT (NUDIX family)